MFKFHYKIDKIKEEIKENINLGNNFVNAIKNKESLNTLENTAYTDCLDKLKQKLSKTEASIVSAELILEVF